MYEEARNFHHNIGTEHLRPAKKLELERRPIPSSSIQQMKDMAGLSDMPNDEFVAWFQRLVSVCKNLRIITAAHSYDEYLETLTPAAIPVSGENGPHPAA